VTATVVDTPVTPTVTPVTATVCKGTDVVFTASGGGTGATYSWTGSPAGTASTNSASYTVSGSATGTKSVTAVAANAGCSGTRSSTVTATVVDAPVTPTVTPVTATVCKGTDVVFTASGGGTGATYSWTGSPAGTASGAGSYTYTVSGSATGTKSVTAVAANAGCSGTRSSTVTATVVDTPGTPTVTPVTATVCKGTDVVFTASGGGTGATYSWTGSPAGTASTNSASYTISGATTGTKSVTAVAANAGCSGTRSSTVTATVVDTPGTPTGVSNSRCGTGSINVSASLSGAVIDWYSASSGGTTLAIGSNTYTVSSLTATTTYYAEARNSTTGCVSASRAAVTATRNEVPSVTLSSGSNNQSVNTGTAIGTIKYTASNATIIYQGGTLPTGVSSSVTGSTTLNIYGTPSATGTFGYTVSSSHTNGCVSSTTLAGTITVNMGTYSTNGGPNTAYSTSMWVFDRLTWSDRVAVSACNKTSFTESDTDPQCRSYTVEGVLWYYYNWSYTIANQGTICPSPWRVPTSADLLVLIYATTNMTLINEWGYSSYVTADGIDISNLNVGYFWSSTEGYENIRASRLHYTEKNLGRSDAVKFIGFPVRCVKD
jgi:uncharacterized protein (TIGR02145 family)